MPMIPVLVGCALITAFLSILRIVLDQGFNIVISSNPWYLLFSNTGSLASSYLVIYICINCGKNWGMNVPTAMAIGLFLCLAGTRAQLIPGWADFLKYSASIFTGMAKIFLASKIEKFFKTKINDNFQMFVILFVTILISCTFAMLVFGPIMSWIEYGLEWITLNGLQNKYLYGFGLALLGFLMGPLIMTGIHQALITIGTRQYTVNPGYNTLYIGMLCNNIAQGAAALAVAAKTKDQKMKALAYSSGPIALLGITEPALFGVNLRNKRAFFSTMFGTFCGAWYGAAMGAAITVYGGGSPSILTILFATHLESITQAEVDALLGEGVCILGQTPLNQWFTTLDGQEIFLQGHYTANGLTIGWMNMANIAISIAISFVVTFLYTFFTHSDENKEIWIGRKLSPVKGWFASKNQKYKDSKFHKSFEKFVYDTKCVFNKQMRTEKQYKNSKKLGKLYSPLEGKYIKLENCGDPTFASGTMGQGFAIDPSKGILYAPFNGEVTMLFDTKHAIGLKSNDGLEVLIHIGMDTVKLNGSAFKTKFKVGDKFLLGQKIMKFDIKKIKKNNLSIITTVIVTNASDLKMLTINKNEQKLNNEKSIINFSK